MSHHAWFEHFKEQLQGLTESFEQSGSPLSLLGYALKEQRLRSDEYLNWAMTHFKLPQLQSRFFSETPLSQEMFAKWATHYPWSVECLPVAEWDGSLIVACLQPPQDFPSTPSNVIVLAKAEDLQIAWNHFHPAKSAATSVVEVATPAANLPESEAPDGIDLSMSTFTKQGGAEGFSFEDLKMADSEPASESLELAIESSEKSDAMEGLFDGPTVIRLEALNPQETSQPLDPVLAPLEEAPEIENKTEVAELPPVENSQPAIPVTAAAVTPTPAQGKIPPPPPKSDLPPAFEESFGNKTIPITSRPAGVAKPTINPVAVGNFALEKFKKKNAVAINDKIKKTLSEMKAHFDKSMILTLDDEETQLTAFAWDENFQGIKDTSMRVSLQNPSVFRIVASTQKPFHGYISLNEINEKFFESWNQGKIPDHVTISPIIVNEKLVGMLMGFAEKSAYNKISLNLAEKLSTDFVKGLQAA